MKPLSPFFKYFGSKCRSGRLYPPPRHKRLVESCAGGAGYALNHHDRDVVLFDIDPRVIEIWRYLIASTPADIMALPLMEPGQHIDSLDVSGSARLFISCCVNSSQFRNVLTAWKNGQNDGLWGAAWRLKVASQIDAIKHWTAHVCSYEAQPNETATRFVDPPYEALDDHYASKSKRIDYEHLAVWCRSRRGQTIVCEQGGAKWLPFRDLAEVAAVRNSAGRKCTEAIWTNDGLESGPEPAPLQRPRGQVALFGT